MLIVSKWVGGKETLASYPQPYLFDQTQWVFTASWSSMTRESDRLSLINLSSKQFNSKNEIRRHR